MSEKTFLIPVGWSPNIGNAFFALGAQYVLQKAVPGARVELTSDQAAYLNFYPGPTYRKEPRNSLRYLDYVRPDYIVLAGSLLTSQFPRVWGRSFRKLSQAGVKIILLGVGYYDYSREERLLCREFLQKFPPYVLVSRDHRTYEDLKDIAEYAYDGLDNAYFLPEVYRPIPSELPPYIILNFDKTPEPIVRLVPDVEIDGINTPNIIRFEFQGKKWEVKFPRLRFAVSRIRGVDKAYGFIAAPLGMHGTKQYRVGNWMIIRTVHQFNPVNKKRIFRGPNTFAGDLPYVYLDLYAQTSLTLSDRIHAVLATLVYGKPAMLFSKSGRALILERVGAGDVVHEPVYLDLSFVQKEKERELRFLKTVPF